MFITGFSVATCCGMEKAKIKEGEALNTVAKVLLASSLSDALISISALVVGILGALSIIHGMPPAASYTLIGLSGGTTLIWAALTACTKGGILNFIKKVFVHACTDHSESDSTPMSEEESN